MSGEGSGSQTAVLVVGASATTHRLQMESLIPTPPQVNSQGCVLRSRTPEFRMSVGSSGPNQYGISFANQLLVFINSLDMTLLNCDYGSQRIWTISQEH